MKRVTDTIKEVQYRRLLKRSFEPRKEFMESSREAFLAEVAKRRVAPYAPQLAWHAFGMQVARYSAVFASIALLGTSGLVAYADNRNVSVESPLYPLKRMGEQVRLTVVSAAKEPELRKEFAHRRANELAEIETKNRPDDDGDMEQLRVLETKEKELREEFRKNVEKIEEDISEHDGAVSTIASGAGLCQAAQAVEKHAGNGKSERYKKFEDRCKNLLESEDDDHTVTSTDAVLGVDGMPEGNNARNGRAKSKKQVEDRSDRNIEQE